VVQNSKDVEQPEDYHDDDHAIENLLDLAIHGDVSVDEPEEDSDDDEADDD
jgi:hypothetical protein